VTLVRAEVWQVKEEIKELERYISAQMSASDIGVVANYPSKFADDAGYISEFLEEIGRNSETRLAVASGGVRPTGNWIYSFRDFKDISEVLYSLTFSGLTSDEAAFRKALQYELVELLRGLLIKYNDTVIDPRPAIKRFFLATPILKEHDGPTLVRMSEWRSFSMLMFQLLGPKNFELIVARESIVSSVFMEFDVDRKAYVSTEIYDLIVRLLDEVKLMSTGSSHAVLELLFKYSPRNVGRDLEIMEFPWFELAALVSLSLRWHNVVSICLGLIAALNGNPLVPPSLLPRSPIVGMQDEIDKEELSIDEIRSYLGIA